MNINNNNNNNTVTSQGGANLTRTPESLYREASKAEAQLSTKERVKLHSFLGAASRLTTETGCILLSSLAPLELRLSEREQQQHQRQGGIDYRSPTYWGTRMLVEESIPEDLKGVRQWHPKPQSNGLTDDDRLFLLFRCCVQ